MIRLSHFVVLASLFGRSASFSAQSPKHQPPRTNAKIASACSRRVFGYETLTTAGLLTAGASLGPRVASAQDATAIDEGGVTLYKLPSGLKYIELKPGTGSSPAYGQLLTVSYTAYVKLPNKNKEKFDSSRTLLKHGNGRTIAGLDEGLHTMKVGGIRRIIIPPKLGYVESGLGPLPSSPFDRRKLNKLLDQMVAVRNGDVIFDVELQAVLDDEASQGYYDDSSLTPEQFNTLRNNLQEKASKAAAERMKNGEGNNFPTAPTV